MPKTVPSAKPRRTQEQRSSEMRLRLLDATIDCLVEYGYAGTTTLSAGTLAVANDNAVGAGTLSLGAATIQASGGSHSLGNTVTLAGNTIWTALEARLPLRFCP